MNTTDRNAGKRESGCVCVCVHVYVCGQRGYRIKESIINDSKYNAGNRVSERVLCDAASYRIAISQVFFTNPNTDWPVRESLKVFVWCLCVYVCM